MNGSVTATAVDPLLIESFERLLGDTATFAAVEQAEDAGWAPDLWSRLAEAGFPWVSIAESAGGSGGTLADAMALLRCVGAHAAPVPMAETGVLGGWLLAAAGHPLPSGPLGVVADPAALVLDGDRLVGSAVVAWASKVDRIVGLVDGGADRGWHVVSLEPSQAAIEGATNLAGEPRDLVTVEVLLSDVERSPAPVGVDGVALRRRGALTRVNLAAGALRAMAQLTVQYAGEREQFGRPIASFQAVQQHLVIAAQAAARVEMAAELATRAVGRGGGHFEVGAAKAVADRAIAEATRAAHQAHGAMGVTREYPLHHLSRRLWAWRHEYGTARQWRAEVGRSVGTAGADGLWSWIANP
jgi:acyl-CoA dehydrogenase